MKFSKRGILLITLLILNLVIPLSVLSNQDTSTKQLSFAMFAPRTDFFWPLQEAFMRDACDDLHIQCQVYYSNDNQYEMKRQIESVITGQKKVDAVIFHNYKQQGKTFIKLAEKNGVASFLINTPLSSKDYKIMGKPREKYKKWLGESVPDDQYAGYFIAKEIINAASKLDRHTSDEKIGMIAINGIVSDGATIERKKGLQKAIDERNDIVLYQYFTTKNWSDKEAINKYIGSLSRYPNILAVWAGDDNLALAILQAAKKHNRIAGKDFFIAGIGWSKAGLKAVENGTFVADIGGHFIEAAWATILLYDYFNGIDFKDEGLQLKLPMYPIYKENIKDVQLLYSALEEDRIDFSAFSKFKNPEVKEYHLQLNDILNQIK